MIDIKAHSVCNFLYLVLST